MQLRRVGWRETPSVFDWLITPWDAVLDVMADGGARLATDFEPPVAWQGAVCRNYGLIYFHEFAQDAAGNVIIDAQRIRYCRSKLLHKKARMDAACSAGDPVLFIRSGAGGTAPSDRLSRDDALSGADLDRFAALVSRLFPALLFSLLYVERHGVDRPMTSQAADPRVLTVTMERSATRSPGDISWASNAAWDSLFARIPRMAGGVSLPFDEQLFLADHADE